MSSAEDLSYHASAASLWILIECTTNESTVNNYYKVISATDVVAPREQMHTGKSIKYRVGKTIFDGTIVIISDDKIFLETELVQLQKKLSTNQLNVQYESASKVVYKRRRTNNDPTIITAPKILNRKTPSPAWSASTNESIIVQTNTNQFTIPPMTFDQQTQTNFKSDDSGINVNDLTDICAKLQHITTEQNHLQQSQINTNEQLTNLSQDCQQIRYMVEEILKRFEKVTSVIVEEHELIQQPLQKEDEELIYQSTPNRIAKNNDYSEIEILDYNQDSLHSMLSGSHLPSNQSSINSTLYSSSSNVMESGKKQGNSTKKATKRKLNKTVEILKSEWNDENENEEELQEQIPIGNNKTTVAKSILKRINWGSHTTATRKLLSSLFSRETLATHSLTGKPSPGEDYFSLFLLNIIK